jgi:CheY-like chemotaxis protein
LELHEGDFELREVLEGLGELMATRAKEKSLEFHYFVDPRLPTRWHGDSSRLRQVLTNLIATTIKFTERGHVELAVEHCGGRDAGERAEFRIRGSGQGVPPDVFRPYAAEADVGAAGQAANGLGISISKRLVELMGGELVLDSGDSQLRGFRFSLGCGLTATRTSGATDAPELRNLRVLAVAGGSVFNRILGRYAEAWGLQLQQANSTSVALEILRAQRHRDDAVQVVLVAEEPNQRGALDFAAEVKSDLALRPTRLLLLRCLGSKDRPAALARAGFDAWVPQPAGPERLATALAYVAKTSSSYESKPFPGAPPARERADGQHARLEGGLRVLLVDDNVVNQHVVGMLLRSMGCQVKTAANGEAAVGLHKEQHFDLVLMDCLMPVMDGFSAAKSIRELPHAAHPSVPIIAMSSNALGGERQRCLDAGMNDYLTKPVQKKDLAKALDVWGSAARDATTHPKNQLVTMQSNQDEVLDRATVAELKELGGLDEPGLFAELVGLFLGDTPARIQQIMKALDENDAATLERAAHALKSSAANLGALKLSSLCKEIEAAGRERNVPKAAAFAGRTAGEFERVKQALEREVAG